MASESITRTLSRHLSELMDRGQLKLEYVAASAGVGIETVRRDRNGEVGRLWDRTARKLVDFVERETSGQIDLRNALEAPERSIGNELLLGLAEGADGIYLIQDQRIVFSNPQVESMTGYSSEELSSQIYTRFLDVDSRKQETERRRQRQEGMPLSDRYEVAVIRKDGNRVRAETQIARLSLGGKKTALGTIREV